MQVLLHLHSPDAGNVLSLEEQQLFLWPLALNLLLCQPPQMQTPISLLGHHHPSLQSELRQDLAGLPTSSLTADLDRTVSKAVN